MKRFVTIFLSVLCAGALHAQPIPTSIYVDHWDDNAWEAIFRHVNSLDMQGRIDTSFSYETAQGNWVLNDIMVHEYDAMGRLEVQRIEYQQSGVEMEHEIRYTYTLNGLPDEKKIYRRNNATSPWEELVRVSYLYNAQDRLFRETSSALDNGQVVSSTRYTYAYDTQGRPDEVLVEMSEGQPGWEPFQRWIYGYDSGQSPDQRLVTQWSTATQAWVNRSLWHYEYNPDGSIAVETEQDWNGLQGGWVNLFRYRYYYGVLAVGETAEVVPEIYPNPVGSTLHITLGQQAEGVTITDLSGKTLLQQPVSGSEQQLDVTALPAGVYLLHVTTSGRTSVCRFVKT